MRICLVPDVSILSEAGQHYRTPPKAHDHSAEPSKGLADAAKRGLARMFSRGFLGKSPEHDLGTQEEKDESRGEQVGVTTDIPQASAQISHFFPPEKYEPTPGLGRSPFSPYDAFSGVQQIPLPTTPAHLLQQGTEEGGGYLAGIANLSIEAQVTKIQVALSNQSIKMLQVGEPTIIRC